MYGGAAASGVPPPATTASTSLVAQVSAAATPRCNGVVLLAGGKPRPTTCVLWNPAIADEEKEVTIPVSTRDDCAILGLGYSATTKTYKLLLTRRRMRSKILLSSPPIVRYPKELLVYTLSSGGVERKKKPRLRTVLSGEGVVGEITGQSLYMDGTIYLLHVSKSAILAFDVDSETVTNIGLPEPRHAISKLMEVSGRPCLDMYDRRQWRIQLFVKTRSEIRYSKVGQMTGYTPFVQKSKLF
ncbi:hypothetical protein SEVIR_9G037301v4 [Setaria viridis]